MAASAHDFYGYCDALVSEELTEAMKEKIRKTADWVLKNPDKESIIIQRSKNDPKLR